MSKDNENAATGIITIIVIIGLIWWFYPTDKKIEKQMNNIVDSSKEDDSYLYYEIIGSGYYKTVDSYSKPDGVYLVVNIMIHNRGKKERMIPPLYLIDKQGREYGSDSTFADNELPILKDLNPGSTTSGIVCFDVGNPNLKYSLRVSGGYWSTNEKIIPIFPKWY